jgi:CheY-like chemotaxis protein
VEEKSPSKIRVLIADDDPGILLILSNQLKSLNYEVLTTTSGAEAIELAQTQKPDFLMLDIVMPGVTWVEVIDSVRSFSQLPIIIFSGHPEVTQLALAIGANDSISKPVDPKLLSEKIKRILSAHPGIDEQAS